MNIKKLIIQFARFQVLGIVVFIASTVVYWFLFSYFGIWTWLIANGFGGVFSFFLFRYFNKLAKGLMFECKEEERKN